MIDGCGVETALSSLTSLSSLSSLSPSSITPSSSEGTADPLLDETETLPLVTFFFLRTGTTTTLLDDDPALFLLLVVMIGDDPDDDPAIGTSTSCEVDLVPIRGDVEDAIEVFGFVRILRTAGGESATSRSESRECSLVLRFGGIIRFSLRFDEVMVQEKESSEFPQTNWHGRSYAYMDVWTSGDSRSENTARSTTYIACAECEISNITSPRVNRVEIYGTNVPTLILRQSPSP